MNLPQPLSDLLAPLFEELPLPQAMPELVPVKPNNAAWVDMVAKIATDPAVKANPALEAGLWLYIDELDKSHTISQSIETPVGSSWHGIMHRREGDFWNSKYWFRRAGASGPLAGMDPSAFVDKVEKSFKNNPPELLEYQRNEWQVLFEWCAATGGNK